MTSNATPTRFSEADFRAACALFPSGVTIVTRMLGNGRPYGMTVSSFTSVSLNPPMILVCIDLRAGLLPNLEPGMSFAVNVLSEEHQPLAARFSRTPEFSRFENIAWSKGHRDVPLLDGAVATFACTLSQSVEAGDHRVLIATVEETRRAEGYPLVWCASTYHCLPRPQLPPD